MNTTSPKKVYIESFGCQMNKLDSELVLGRLSREGYDLTENRAEADLILLNTCSVREHAEERVYSRAGSLKTLKKRNPRLIIGIMGCMAQNHQEGVRERLPHVDLVIGPRQLDTLPQHLERIATTRQAAVVPNDDAIMTDEQYRTADGRETPFQAYVKVMEGCDCACTFCIVPTVRGRETSRSPEAIVREAEQLAKDGCVEITLLGQTVNAYGKQLQPRSNLGKLMRMLHAIDGLRRIKYITCHPSFMMNDIVEAMSTLPKVSKYVHIPVQSGSDRILKAMNRGYTIDRYLAIVEKIRSSVSDAEIATDFIVGFPGESDADFQASVDLIRRVGFQNSFVFKYSPRPGTASAALPDDVPREVKEARNNALLAIQKEVSRERHRSLVGRTVEVLVEGMSKRDPRRLTGRTNANHIVVFASDRNLAGTFANVRIIDATHLTLFGELL